MNYSSLFVHSPFLAHLAGQHPALLEEINVKGPDACLDALLAERPVGASLNTDALMLHLRQAKAKTALLTAAVDLSGQWKLAQVTGALSRFAQNALTLTVDSLLAAAAARGEITVPAEGSGIIVLGMGKLGAGELNYSSDIDLIILYERERLNYRGRHTEQKFMNSLAHDMVRIMQERTPAGYVFRTDLRLRPDPASTPPAINTDAALNYYESVGQNWERAAMIKARPVAGDLAAGDAFLASVAPFMWRRNLDFAAIQDIHSIKRQMDTRTGRAITLPGHNIKIGVGGIREIEFFTQIHQLIWGGREPSLRLRGTCETLERLGQMGLVEKAAVDTLTTSYALLRTVEHRLQMINDQQTHSLPETKEELARVAEFCGYKSTKELEQALLPTLHAVHEIFASSFRSSEKLGDVGNLVFTGVSHDPDTLATLTGMGYKNPEVVSETVMGWHHGSRRCTRTKRARELLTELMPTLLKRLSETANPDAAFLKFDEFLGRIPAGVQLFSLFTQNPDLLGLIADIMGNAPQLAETLSRHPDLLDSVLYGDFYDSLPGREALHTQLAAQLAMAHDFGERMEAVRRFKNERQFQAGVQLLKGLADARICGTYLSRLADVVLEHTLREVTAEFEKSYGRIPGGAFCILAMGRLGSEEMTFGSDIDLTFIYDAPDMNAVSDGEKGFAASVYYNRLSQRLLNAITTMGREGRLYEADTRLRPSGTQGLSAVSLSAMEHYFNELAWTFEFMALTRARACAGTPLLMRAAGALIAMQLQKPRDAEVLQKDVIEMRARVEKEYPPRDCWDLKHARGGLMDIEFICQFLLLQHAHKQPGILARRGDEMLTKLQENNILSVESATQLTVCYSFLTRLLHAMRLSSPGWLEEPSAPPALKELLARNMQMQSFDALKAELSAIESKAFSQYIALVGK